MVTYPKDQDLKLGGDDILWVEEELRSLELGDPRLEKRVKKMIGDFGEQLEASIPKASGTAAATKAAYRCLDNEKVEASAVLGAHREATLERAIGEKVVLAVQDTTALNFSTHPETKGLGPLRNNKDTIGLFLHTTLLLRDDGQALGLLRSDVTARSWEGYDKRPAGERNRLPVEKKESFRWLQSLQSTQEAARRTPGVRFINIADREADSYDLFWCLVQMRAGEQPSQTDAPGIEAARRVELLVRCQHNRLLLNGQKLTPQKKKKKSKPVRADLAAKTAAAKAAAASEKRLFGHLATQPAQGEYQFWVPRQPGKKNRQATLAVRFKKIVVPPPPDQLKYQGHTEPLTLWVIEAREENPSNEKDRICWRLLTTMAVEDLATALLLVGYYSLRWEIENFHRILKSGCRAEDRQLEAVERLERCLALDTILAWRVLALSKAGRCEEEGGPASQWLEDYQWKALCCYHQKCRQAPSSPPTTRQAVAWIAQLGGFLGRRGDGFPGPMTLWRGLQRLNDIATAYLLFV